MARMATGRKAPARKSGGAGTGSRKSAAKADAVEPKKKAAATGKAAPAKTGKTAAPARRAATGKSAPAKAATSSKAAPGKAPSRKAAPGKSTQGKSTQGKSTRGKVAASRTTAKAPARKAAVTKTAARKAPPAKTATRKAATARPAPRKAEPRRKVAAVRVPVAAKRKAATPRLKTAAPTQAFTVSHLNEADFQRDGLRPYAVYRDLGIAAATGGLCQAHVIRMIPPCTDEVRQRHVHAVELQLIYVLKGWMKNEFEGHGEQMMEAGTCWLQPPNIKHTVLDYSADLEVLEIIIPADFKTTEAA